MNYLFVLTLVLGSFFIQGCGESSVEQRPSLVVEQFPEAPAQTQPADSTNEIVRVNMKCGEMEYCRHQCSLQNPIGYLYEIAEIKSDLTSEASANGTRFSGATLAKIAELDSYYRDFEACTQSHASKIIDVENLPERDLKSPACEQNGDCENTCFNYYKPTIEQDYLNDAMTLCEPVITNGPFCKPYIRFETRRDNYERCLEKPQNQVMPNNTLN